MPDSPDPIVSETELTILTDLFREFEGASDPRALRCREAEIQFNSILSQIYAERISPDPTLVAEDGKRISYSSFMSYARNECRKRLWKEDSRCF
jgi:hypothetical protein